MVVAFLFLDRVERSFANLKLQGVQCGQITCAKKEFCNKSDNRCLPCENICQEDNHNFELIECETQCQGKSNLHFHFASCACILQ